MSDTCRYIILYNNNNDLIFISTMTMQSAILLFPMIFPTGLASLSLMEIQWFSLKWNINNKNYILIYYI